MQDTNINVALHSRREIIGEKMIKNKNLLSEETVSMVKDAVEDALGWGDDDRVICAYALNKDPDFGPDAYEEAQRTAVYGTLELLDEMRYLEKRIAEMEQREPKNITIADAVREYVNRSYYVVPEAQWDRWYI